MRFCDSAQRWVVKRTYSWVIRVRVIPVLPGRKVRNTIATLNLECSSFTLNQVEYSDSL
jgi:hypothetical protein